MGSKKKGGGAARTGEAKAGKRAARRTEPPASTLENRLRRLRGEQQFYAPLGEHEMVWDPTRKRVVRSCTKAPSAVKGGGNCAAEQRPEAVEEAA